MYSSYDFVLFLPKEYEAARKLFVEMKRKKDEVKRRLEEVKRQNAPMQRRLDEVTNRARELEESSREMVKGYFGLCFS